MAMQWRKPDMSVLGPWIDSLTDEQRDRIVEAQGMRPCAMKYCLVGVVYGEQEGNELYYYNPVVRRIATTFDCECSIAGREVTIKACKLRAGAHVEPLTGLHAAVEVAKQTAMFAVACMVGMFVG